MFVKNLTAKNKGYAANVIDYIQNSKHKESEGHVWEIYHNISTPDTQTAKHEFAQNNRFIRKAKNSVYVYHEVVAFHPKDTPHLSMDVLHQIAQAYIRIRNPNALCFAKPHINDSMHIHFCFHSREYNSKKSLRMDNTQYLRVRQEIERWQMQHFPQIQHSFVYLKGLEKQPKTPEEINQHFQKHKEHQLRKRTKAPINKDTVRAKINQCLQQSKDSKTFYALLQQEGLELYRRNGKIYGIKYKKHCYRFSTMGFDPERKTKVNQRIHELETLHLELEEISKNKSINL